MSNLIVYRFQNKVRVNSTNAALVKFLKAKDGDLTEKERVWWAISAFWLAVAMQESHGYSRSEITQYGLSAIARLQQQIAYLALVLKLEIPAYSNLPPSDRLNTATAIDTARLGNTGEGNSRVTQSGSEYKNLNSEFSDSNDEFDDSSDELGNSNDELYDKSGDELCEENKLQQPLQGQSNAPDSSFDSIFGYK